MGLPKRLIITPGEPAGIAGEILIDAAQEARGLITIDDPDRLQSLAKDKGVSLNWQAVDSVDDANDLDDDTLAILPMTWPEKPKAGTPSPANAPQIIKAITIAAELAKSQKVKGIVTLPIHKATLYEAGFSSAGHTEYLGDLDGTTPVMMLASPMLKVVPLTVHIPLSAVPAGITEEKIMQTAEILSAALTTDFGIKGARIAVAGLNPHAGEGGALGGEDVQIIAPSIEKLQQKGMDITGPFPADTLFHEARRQDYDAVLAMYHDQALIPVKALDFFGSVNITLGLSFIRTSPDHGTALNQAGKNTARAESLKAAIAMAEMLASNRLRHKE